MRKNNDVPEEALRRITNQPGQQDDKSVHKVGHKGKKFTIAERKRELEFIPDPEDGNSLIPITTSETTSHVGDDGIPLGRSSQAGFCKFGCYCNRKGLFVCIHCRQVICRTHTIKVNNRAYCSKGFCAFIGRSYQTFFVLYRIIRFCVCSALGISVSKDENAHRTDDELFDTISEERTHGQAQ